MPQQRECLRLVGTLTRAIERILHSTPHAAPTGISLRAFFFDKPSWARAVEPVWTHLAGAPPILLSNSKLPLEQPAVLSALKVRRQKNQT
jgi:hypothetical protein